MTEQNRRTAVLSFTENTVTAKDHETLALRSVSPGGEFSQERIEFIHRLVPLRGGKVAANGQCEKSLFRYQSLKMTTSETSSSSKVP